jgi:hypothetical protein
VLTTHGQQEGKTGDETRIEVEADKGTTTKADKIVLVLAMKAEKRCRSRPIFAAAWNAATCPTGRSTATRRASRQAARARYRIEERDDSIDAPGAKYPRPRCQGLQKFRPCASTGEFAQGHYAPGEKVKSTSPIMGALPARRTTSPLAICSPLAI